MALSVAFEENESFVIMMVFAFCAVKSASANAALCISSTKSEVSVIERSFSAVSALGLAMDAV